MTADIVERIEARANDSRLEIEAMMDEAAGEIAQLRGDLALWHAIGLALTIYLEKRGERDAPLNEGEAHYIKEALALLPAPNAP